MKTTTSSKPPPLHFSTPAPPAPCVHPQGDLAASSLLLPSWRSLAPTSLPPGRPLLPKCCSTSPLQAAAHHLLDEIPQRPSTTPLSAPTPCPSARCSSQPMTSDPPAYLSPLPAARRGDNPPWFHPISVQRTHCSPSLMIAAASHCFRASTAATLLHSRRLRKCPATNPGGEGAQQQRHVVLLLTLSCYSFTLLAASHMRGILPEDEIITSRFNYDPTLMHARSHRCLI